MARVGPRVGAHGSTAPPPGLDRGEPGSAGVRAGLGGGPAHLGPGVLRLQAPATAESSPSPGPGSPLTSPPPAGHGSAGSRRGFI